MQPCRENILFEIKLTSNFWDRPPRANVMINDECKFNGDVDQSLDTIRFNHVLDFHVSHKLIINRYNKTPDQCLDGKDQLMYIDKIYIDGIDIQNFILCRATFCPQYPEPWATEQKAQGIQLEQSLLGENCFGHNGQWCFEFTAPFWQFLIKAMN